MSRGLLVRLIGPPAIQRDGTAAPAPRGRKSWAALAYVTLAELPVSRERLASLLFCDAADPLGALRWTLAELRRALGVPEALRDDPVQLGLPAAVTLDVLSLRGGRAEPDLVRGELLEGIELNAGPVFDAWLLVERRRIAGLCEGVLRDAALAALAAGRPRDAAALASRALEFSPWEESLHELLVRCLAAGGDLTAARDHADTCESLFRRELGRLPDAGVARAADPDHAPDALGDRGAALAQLRAGMAAIDAGAVEPGMACLRMACAEARALGDGAVLSQVLLELGIGLVHAVRGRDEEGAAVLHEALALAQEAGERELAVAAGRELGYVEVQAGRMASAGRWLGQANLAARGDGERAKLLGVRGMCLSDRAHYDAAIDLLDDSVASAERCGDLRQAAWSLAILGRAQVLRGELGAAAAALDRSLALVDEQGWVAFAPLPEALRSELALRQGTIDEAARLATHSFALGCQLGDPCWEGFAGRALGLCHNARGEHEAAVRCLRDAVARSGRVADSYVWLQGHCLDALAGQLIVIGSALDAAPVVSALQTLAARGDMRELLVRGAIHSARLGDGSALDAVRPLAESIASPALAAELAMIA